MERSPSPDPNESRRRRRDEGVEDATAGAGDRPLRQRGGADASPATPSCPEVLQGGGARQILSRLVDADPLDLRSRATAEVRRGAVLLDPGRLFDRAAARIAFEARRYDGEPPLGEWLDEQLARSMRELLREDRSEDQAGVPPSDGWDPSHVDLGEALGAEPGVARTLCVVFNDLPADKRAVFSAVVQYGRSIDDVSRESGMPRDEVRAVLEEVFTILARVGQDPGEMGGGE